MGKLKGLFIFTIGAVIAIFLYENSGTSPEIKLFGKVFLNWPISVIIVVNLLIGFLAGWLGHFSWQRRGRKAMLAKSIKEPEKQPLDQEEGSKNQEKNAK
jgi:hypothetical protein